MTLTEEEKKRIYEEEKERIDAQEKIKREKALENVKKQSSVATGCIVGIGIIVIGFMLLIVIFLFSSDNRSSSPTGNSPSSAGDAGLVKGLGKDVLQKELDKWKSIGLVTSYEFSKQIVIVYLNHTDWISLTSGNQADFEAGIRSKWPDGSVVFRDSQTGDKL